jgi:hypothetical protein
MLSSIYFNILYCVNIKYGAPILLYLLQFNRTVSLLYIILHRLHRKDFYHFYDNESVFSLVCPKTRLYRVFLS